MGQLEDSFAASEIERNRRLTSILPEPESTTGPEVEQAGQTGTETAPIEQGLNLAALVNFPGPVIAGYLLKHAIKLVAPTHTNLQTAGELIGGLFGGATEAKLAEFGGKEATKAAEKALASPTVQQDIANTAAEQVAREKAAVAAKKLFNATGKRDLEQKVGLFHKIYNHTGDTYTALINAELSNPRISLQKLLTDSLNLQAQTVFRGMGIGVKYGTQAGVKTIMASVRGQIETFSDALKWSARSFKSGLPEFEQSLGKFGTRSFALEHVREQAYAPAYRWISNVAGIGRRTIMTVDQFSKAMAWRSIARMLTYQSGLEEAEKQGLNNWASIDKFATGYSEHMMANMGDDIFEQVANHMHNYTFTDDGKVSRSIAALANDHLPVRLLIPYSRTPLNLFDQGLYMSPGGFISGGFRKDMLSGDEIQRNIAIAKWLSGTALWSLIGYQAAKGNIIGNGPMGPGRQNWPLRKWANTIQIGNERLGFSHLGPFATMLSHAADLYEMHHLSKEPTEQGKIADAATKVTGLMISDPDYMQLAGNIVHAVDAAERDEPHVIPEFLGREAGGFIPAPLRIVDRVLSPGERQANDIVDQLKMNLSIPYYSDQVPYERDQWGEIVYPPIATNGQELLSLPARLGNELSPVPIYSNVRIDPVEAELFRYQVNPRKTPDHIWKRGDVTVPITPQLQDEWSQLTGNKWQNVDGLNQHQAYEELLSDPDYQSADDVDKKKQLYDIHHRFFAGARQQLLDNHPELDDAVDQAQINEQMTSQGNQTTTPNTMAGQVEQQSPAIGGP